MSQATQKKRTVMNGRIPARLMLLACVLLLSVSVYVGAGEEPGAKVQKHDATESSASASGGARCGEAGHGG